MDVSRAQIQIVMTPILSMMIVRGMVMIFFEKKSADQIYRQRHASNSYCLVKMNRKRNKETVDRFAGHEQRYD